MRVDQIPLKDAESMGKVLRLNGVRWGCEIMNIGWNFCCRELGYPR